MLKNIAGNSQDSLKHQKTKAVLLLLSMFQKDTNMKSNVLVEEAANTEPKVSDYNTDTTSCSLAKACLSYLVIYHVSSVIVLIVVLARKLKL